MDDAHATIAASDGTATDLLDRGRAVLRAEGEAVLRAAAGLDASFCRAVMLIAGCTGKVVVTGIGKAGLVAQKIAATLASTGTPSHFLHPAEAMHGDLGVLRRDDLLLALSQSGETEEITRLLPHVAAAGVRIVALTGRADSTLGRASAVVVVTGALREACGLGLAPSTSTSVLLALGDALALVTSGLRRFTPEDFAARHPGGSLGRQLMRVDDAMPRPTTVQCGTRLRDAVALLDARRLSELPVLDATGRPVGLLDIVDVLGLAPSPAADAGSGGSGSADAAGTGRAAA